MVGLDLPRSPNQKLIVEFLLRSPPVTLQKPAKSLMTDDLTILGLWQGGDDIIAYALVWPLCVVVFDILINHIP